MIALFLERSMDAGGFFFLEGFEVVGIEVVSWSHDEEGRLILEIMYILFESRF